MIQRIRHPGRPPADIPHGPMTPVTRHKGTVPATALADAVPPDIRGYGLIVDKHQLRRRRSGRVAT